jgi:phage-related protein
MANGEPPDTAIVVWEGDSLDVLRSFPKAIRAEFGADIFRLQRGQRPLDFKPMKSVGLGVFELRQRDDRGWYRIIYLSRVGDTIYMLHSFVKKSAKTSSNDLKIAEGRLKEVRRRLREER